MEADILTHVLPASGFKQKKKKKKKSEILSNLDQTRVWFKTTLFHNGYLQDNQDLVLHNLQADADGQPWSTIIINNLVDHALGKLCQTMVNHGWLRCYFRSVIQHFYRPMFVQNRTL